MIPTKKYFHLFLILSEFILAITMMNLFVYGIRLKYDIYEIFWICSKIKTISEMLEEKIGPLYPENITNFNYSTYTDLKKLLNRDNNFHYIDYINSCSKQDNKKCGKLDTLGNYLCIPNNNICPINELKYIETIDKDFYQRESKLDLGNNFSLILSNGDNDERVKDKEIVVFLYTETPRYINDNNFKFDVQLFKDLFNIEEDKFDNTKEYAKAKKHIQNRMNEDKNTDKYAKLINNQNFTLYSKNYIGFKSIKDMKLLISKKDNLINLYKIDFPNLASTIFSIFCFITFLILIIFSLIRFFSSEKPKKYEKYPDLVSKLIICGIYLTVFIGYFIYFIYICAIGTDSHNCSDLKKIKSDDFIEDYIKEVCDKITLQKYVIVIGLVLFIISIILFIIAFFIEKIYILILKLQGRKLDLQWLRIEKKYKLSY